MPAVWLCLPHQHKKERLEGGQALLGPYRALALNISAFVNGNRP